MLLESSELLKLSVMLDSYFSSAKGTQLDKAVRSGQAIGMIYFDRFLSYLLPISFKMLFPSKFSG